MFFSTPELPLLPLTFKSILIIQKRTIVKSLLIHRFNSEPFLSLIITSSKSFQPYDRFTSLSRWFVSTSFSLVFVAVFVARNTNLKSISCILYIIFSYLSGRHPIEFVRCSCSPIQQFWFEFFRADNFVQESILIQLFCTDTDNVLLVLYYLNRCSQHHYE